MLFNNIALLAIRRVMIKIIPVIFIMVGLHAWADSGEKVLAGYDPKVDIISENYEAGPFLIYDCKERHFVCVLESYSKECAQERALAIHEKRENLECAPIVELPTKKSCFQQQLFMISQNHGTRFCIGDDWKQKEIEF